MIRSYKRIKDSTWHRMYEDIPTSALNLFNNTKISQPAFSSNSKSVVTISI
jgi:hypothetical protein